MRACKGINATCWRWVFWWNKIMKQQVRVAGVSSRVLGLSTVHGLLSSAVLVSILSHPSVLPNAGLHTQASTPEPTQPGYPLRIAATLPSHLGHQLQALEVGPELIGGDDAGVIIIASLHSLEYRREGGLRQAGAGEGWIVGAGGRDGWGSAFSRRGPLLKHFSGGGLPGATTASTTSLAVPLSLRGRASPSCQCNTRQASQCHAFTTD
jgi:hypothetical protein